MASSVQLPDDVMDDPEALRDDLEARLLNDVPGLVVAGKGGRRLPNTSCLVSPGWKGETQVMQMDLAGFAISAGSACSSGKVRASRVLRAISSSMKNVWATGPGSAIPVVSTRM